ncbi:hypothetical protein V7O66_03400 [Methanolobus sp. ZRKC3]|uniref:hypothetical protein n=1 Tax=Methanolobus sp. ZRKC3 TaxID=3125786 RepID=UPI00324AAD48
MIPPSNLSNLTLAPTNQIQYMAMTWHDFQTVCIIVAIISMCIGYGINELWHRHNCKKEV